VCVAALPLSLCVCRSAAFESLCVSQRCLCHKHLMPCCRVSLCRGADLVTSIWCPYVRFVALSLCVSLFRVARVCVLLARLSAGDVWHGLQMMRISRLSAYHITSMRISRLCASHVYAHLTSMRISRLCASDVLHMPSMARLAHLLHLVCLAHLLHMCKCMCC